MPLPATHEIHVFGSLNGIEFDLVGRGSGNPKDGSQELQVKSTKGSLPFSAQILIPHFGYGFYQYLPYPDGMSPFQAAMHDGKGYNVSRTMMFQDGAIMDAQYRYTYEGSHIKGEMQVVGTGFPADGPVMTKSLKAADWNVTKMVYPDNKTIRATYDWTYTTTSGKRYQSSVRTNHTFASPIAANILQQEPMFVFRKTELKGNAQDTEFTFRELQKAFSDLM